MLNKQRTVAQLGSALDWGSRGRGFKSRQPDGEARVGSLFPAGLAFFLPVPGGEFERRCSLHDRGQRVERG